MLLLVGLGNPGSEYDGTRHNIGFATIRFITEYYKFTAYKRKFSGHYATGEIDGHKILTLMPATYMNNSGVSVNEAASFYKIPLPDIFVFHDDLDLELGRIKVKTGGGNGGHNGLASLDEHIGNEYTRIRVGIGHPLRRSASEASPGNKDVVTDYVLTKFKKTEKAVADKVIINIADHLPFLLNDHPDKFMSKIAEQINGL